MNNIQLPDWVVKSGNIPTKFSYTEDGVFVWESGIWKGGIWNRGYWKNGIWENGIWNGGFWENGTWKDGVWKSGTRKDDVHQGYNLSKSSILSEPELNTTRSIT